MSLDQVPFEVIDRPLVTFIDTTTDANYTFVADTTQINAAYTDPVWRCYRITNASGTLTYATDPVTLLRTDAPVLKASQVATYTY